MPKKNAFNFRRDAGCLVSGCLVLLVPGLYPFFFFWPITSVLCLAFCIIAYSLLKAIAAYQADNKDLLAKNWTRLNNKKPCCISGIHGHIEELQSDAKNLTLLFRPIEAFCANGELPTKSYSIEWIDSSLRQTLNALFKAFNVSMLTGVSVEKTSIETALHCQNELAWCVKSLDVLTEMSVQIERALLVSKGNRLLEPSIPNFLEVKKRITEETANIIKARDETSQMLEDIVGYLSVPSELRQAIEIDIYGHEVTARYVELRTSFDFLVDFNQTYTKLLS